MPIAAAAAIPLATAGLNAVSDMQSNRRNEAFSAAMYQRQRKDAIEFWNMQNAYNSPAEQMKRFQAAGLNPNLIYGQAGDNSAANIPVPDAVPVQYRAPHVEVGAAQDAMSVLLGQADLKIKAAQANNLEAQTEVIRQDALLRTVQAKQAGFNYDFANEFRSTQADMLSEHVRQMRVSSDLAMNRDAREAVSNSTSVSEAAQRILNLIEQRKGFAVDRAHTSADTFKIYQDIKQMQKDGSIKDFEIKLNNANMTKSDPLWTRMILDFLSGKGVPGAPNSPNMPYNTVPLTPKR